MTKRTNRITELLAANNRYVENNRLLKAALIASKEKFEFYAESHRQKQTKDADQKMIVNLEMVDMINNVLTQTSPI